MNEKRYELELMTADGLQKFTGSAIQLLQDWPHVVVFGTLTEIVRTGVEFNTITKEDKNILQVLLKIVADDKEADTLKYKNLYKEMDQKHAKEFARVEKIREIIQKSKE